MKLLLQCVYHGAADFGTILVQSFVYSTVGSISLRTTIHAMHVRCQDLDILTVNDDNVEWQCAIALSGM